MPNYDSDYEVRLAELAALGGDTTVQYDSVYEIDLAILEIIQGGIGTDVIDDTTVSTSTTFSSSKITELLASAGFDVQIVQELPATGVAHTIYFVPSATSAQANVYDEFIYVNNAWEQIGSTAIDLTDYATKAWVVDQSYITASSLPDMTQYYTKSQTDVLLDDKAEVVELTQDEYDALSSAEKNNGKIYSITDATLVDMNNYYTKTQADARYNPYNTTTQYTSGMNFPYWNARGQITGKGTTIYGSSANFNGSSRTLYTSSSTALPNVFAPTTAGTAGQYLVSNGSGAPVWQDLEVASDYVIADADAIAGNYSTDIAAFYLKTMEEGIVQGVQIKVVNTHYIADVDDSEAITTLADGDSFAVTDGKTVTINVEDTNSVAHAIVIGTDGTITDADSTDCVVVSQYSAAGYHVYSFTDNSAAYTFTSISGTDTQYIFAATTDTETSDSFYLPSSSRIYEGNVELWLMTTEDGQTWENIHYLITGSSISRDVTTGNFGV